MKKYTDKEFINKLKPDMINIDSDVLLNYFQNNVMDKEYLHILKDGRVVNMNIGGNNFFHATGLQHSKEIMNTIYEGMTSVKASVTNPHDIKNIVQGFKVYDHLLKNNYELPENHISPFEISRLSRFNRIHSILDNPDSIIAVDKELANNKGALAQGDLIFSKTDTGKIQGCIISHDAEKNNWYLKSYYVDRPNYCVYKNHLKSEKNLKNIRVTFPRHNPIAYIEKVYINKYPFVKKFGYSLASSIKRMNESRGQLFKLTSFKDLYVIAKTNIDNAHKLNQPLPKDAYKTLNKLKDISDKIELAEEIYNQENELTEEIIKEVSKTNEIDMER